MDAVLDLLIEAKAIQEAHNKIEVRSDEVIYDFWSHPQASEEMMAQLLDFAKSQLRTWMPRPEDSYLTSTVLSVKKEDYQQSLSEIREFFESMQSRLEVSSGGDMLAYFNLFIFPELTGQKKEQIP